MNRLLLPLFALYFAVYGFCQSSTAEVTGRISDATGAFIPGARIQLTNVNTMARWQATTNDSGNYSLSLLPPGTYRLTANKQGFKTVHPRGLRSRRLTGGAAGREPGNWGRIGKCPRNRVVEGLLGGWHYNGIFTALTGQPLTAELGFSAANTGDPRPDRIANGNLPSDRRSITNWFDKTAFVAPSPFNYGNAGRNIIEGPSGMNLDFSTFKSFHFPLRTESG